MKTKKAPHLRAKARAARTSLTVWYLSTIPVLIAAAESAKDVLPELREYLNGWTYAGLSVVLSVIGAYLRVRRVRADTETDTADSEGL